jgi:hypothetical protein
LSRQNIKFDERKARRWSILLLFVPLIYTSSIVIICAIQKVPFSFTMETCVHGDAAERPNLVVNVAVTVPNLLLIPIVSLVSDAAIVWTLRKEDNRRTGNSFDAVPIRATLLSAATLASLLVAILCKQTWTSELGFATGILVSLNCLVAARCPAATFISFAYKSKKERLSRRSSRDLRLKKVLLHASMEREEMRRAREVVAQEQLWI